MQHLYHYEAQPGYQKMAGPGQGGLERLEMGVLRVPRDETYQRALQGHEAVLVILSGECQVDIDGQSWTLDRVSVFAEPAMGVYVPRHRKFTVTGIKPADLVLFTAPAREDFLPRLITRDPTRCRVEGADGFERQACTLVGEEFPASRLLVGETYAEGGRWASFPPHKHDEDNFPYEVRLEQASFYQIDPPQGFAMQYRYTQDRSLNDVFVVHNDDAFVTSRGYHPLVSAPGYRLYELWAMAGDGHVIRSSMDPDHAWVAQEAGAPEAVAAPA